MAAYRVELSRPAAKMIRDFDQKMRVRIISRLRALAENPRPDGVKKQQGEESVYRVRERDYRILYEIFDKKLMVVVLKVGQRRDSYK
ncbi:MAG: type II toxin-antitoxin system RelE/ParE family toxin [Gammaproteobacteria bacterium]|nr:type II toxin-antitoxin system RelE/ParE family toxin [Gammaproteobacteria bacterium]